jgi:hypothetical protein
MAGVASIHVLLQQNYAAPGKQTYVSESESPMRKTGHAPHTPPPAMLRQSSTHSAEQQRGQHQRRKDESRH